MSKRIKRLLGHFSSDADLKLGTPVISHRLFDYREKAALCSKGSENFQKFQDLEAHIREAKTNFYNEELLSAVFDFKKQNSDRAPGPSKMFGQS